MAKKQSIIFMSGVGSNAEALLDFSINHKEAEFEVAALFSDRPDQSRTYEIAEKYNLEVLSLDIFKFYQNYGEEVINLATPRRVEIRNLWTREVSKILKNFGNMTINTKLHLKNMLNCFVSFQRKNFTPFFCS